MILFFKRIMTVLKHIYHTAEQSEKKRDRQLQLEDLKVKLAEGFALIEATDQRVTVIRMTPLEFSDVRKLTNVDETSMIDTNTNAQTLRRGLMGYLWGAEIQVSRRYEGITFLTGEEISIAYQIQQESGSISVQRQQITSDSTRITEPTSGHPEFYKLNAEETKEIPEFNSRLGRYEIAKNTLPTSNEVI